MFAKSCVFGKQSALPILCSFSLGLILVSLLRYFAEFLKDYSSLTFVFSTCLLVSDWYSFSKKRLFPIISLSSTHRSSPFGVLGLGAASPYSLGFRSIFRCSLLILAFSHSIFYELFCYLFSSPSFGADLCHLNSWRSTTILMHCYVFSQDGCFQAYFLGVFVVELSLHYLILFMTLTSALGCFPFDLGPYRSKSVYFLFLL